MKLLEMPIDETLTPGSANERGYTYELDLSSLTPLELHDIFLELVEKQGFKIGQPKYRLADDNTDRGLYAPVERKEKTSLVVPS
jgi:hypothetical protein